MRLPTPRWWYRRTARPGFAALLIPASRIWASATAGRIARGAPFDPGVPVVCVGNLTLGGSGKTPVAREVTRLLSREGASVHILMRGHGGRLAGPVRVDLGEHAAADVGDEALMLAGDAPVWVARDRAAGAKAAAEAGAKIIVMDDGHQNPAVSKAVSLVVIDAETRDGEWPFGGGGVFPAGPLREPLDAGLARADAVVLLLPADLSTVDEALRRIAGGKPVLVARLQGAPPPAGRRLGFAAIAKPWKMERALLAAGCDLAGFVGLADHAPLSERVLARLARRARSLGAELVCSEKDWARLPEDWRNRVEAWPVRAVFEDAAGALAILHAGARRGAGPSSPKGD